jgi:hypothetical protein
MLTFHHNRKSVWLDIRSVAIRLTHDLFIIGSTFPTDRKLHLMFTIANTIVPRERPNTAATGPIYEAGARPGVDYVNRLGDRALHCRGVCHSANLI